MEALRRFAAALIAISLVLPERSCMNNGHVEIGYPLTDIDGVWQKLLVAAVYLVPLCAIYASRFKVSSLISGAAASGVGLYFGSYCTWALGYKLLIGWYTFTVGAATYAASSITLLIRLGMAKISKKRRDNGRA